MNRRWLGMRLEGMGTVMNLAAALLIVLSRDSSSLTVKGGVAGLILTYTQQARPIRYYCYYHTTCHDRVLYVVRSPESFLVVHRYCWLVCTGGAYDNSRRVFFYCLFVTVYLIV